MSHHFFIYRYEAVSLYSFTSCNGTIYFLQWNYSVPPMFLVEGFVETAQLRYSCPVHIRDQFLFLQSPRGGEPAVHTQMGMLPPMQLDVSGHVSGPIGPPMYGPRGGYSEPALYHGDMVYQLQASPPPPAVAMSRLNPRAPDFSFGAKPGMARPGRWAYGPGPQELVFPAGQSVSDLLTNFDNGLAPSPSMSPSSPIQAGLTPGKFLLPSSLKSIV